MDAIEMAAEDVTPYTTAAIVLNVHHAITMHVRPTHYATLVVSQGEHLPQLPHVLTVLGARVPSVVEEELKHGLIRVQGLNSLSLAIPRHVQHLHQVTLVAGAHGVHARPHVEAVHKPVRIPAMAQPNPRIVTNNRVKIVVAQPVVVHHDVVRTMAVAENVQVQMMGLLQV